MDQVRRGPTTTMDHSASGWIFNTARKNHWRVSRHHDFEDLVQDGYYFYHRICAKYPNVTEPKHRMALLKTAFTNHIHNLSKAKTRLDLVPEADLETPLDHMLETEDPSQDPNLGFIINQLPPAIQRVLQRVLHSDGPYRRFLDFTRATNKEYLCGLAGLNPKKRDLEAAVLRYLKGDRLHPEYD